MRMRVYIAPIVARNFADMPIADRMAYARAWGTYDGLTGANHGGDRFAMWIGEGNAYRHARDAARATTTRKD